MSTMENNNLPPELREELAGREPADRESLEHVWHLLGNVRLATREMPDAGEMWIRLSNQIQTESVAEPLPRHPRMARLHEKSGGRTSVRPGYWAVAAVLAVSLAVATFLWLNRTVEFAAPPGQQLALSLPDGSAVELGGGSTLAYQRASFGIPFLPERPRTVSIHGEAFFDVTGSKGSFVVETINARIEVLGTRFDVQSWSAANDPETRVTLQSGSVRVTAKALPTAEVILRESGQFSRVVGEGVVPTLPEEADFAQVSAWRQHGFFASQQPLSTILARLELRFGVEIALSARAAASDEMTLYYSRQVDLETILHDICVAKGLSYRETSRGFEIFDVTTAGETDHT